MDRNNDWVRPEIPTSALTYAVTSSVVEEFAHGHTVSDVLRELVQNEYDAQGSSLRVVFGEDGLHVVGTGNPIDRGGWQRLSVMLGTGRVAGESRDVARKINGIGSKNHGLRSLFLFGDQIYVRSAGLQTLLDLYQGALREPLPDEAPPRKGVSIFVPYRTKKNGLLDAYSPEREARDFDLLGEQLAPTLMKLAQPGAPRSLRQVWVRSVRRSRALHWKQDAKLVGRHGAGGPIVRREIVVGDEALDDRGSRIAELEYQKVCPVPQDHRARAFPHYFRPRPGHVRLGVSLRVARNRIDVQHRGSFYYPLGASQATGCAVSASAPFEMNAERTALVDPGNSPWNGWLLDRLADFTIELLVANWFGNFGDASYRALATLDHSPTGSLLAERLQRRLAEAQCWPTRAATPSRRPVFVAASKIFIGASESLDAVVSENWRLHQKLAGVADMARGAGAVPFTLASAVRLRCAGENASQLKTRVDASTCLYYTNFPAELNNVDLQEKFAAAFDAHRRQLTRENRQDIAGAATTLTAAGDLGAPTEPLWVVDSSVRSVAPVPNEQRLHPRLTRYKAITQFCRSFDPSDWAKETALRAREGRANDEDRERLYKYLLRAPGHIRRSAWPSLRRSPIVRDHRGEWVEPVNLVDPRARGARALEAALHFPSSEVISSPEFLRVLRMRTEVTGAELVRHAAIVAEDPGLAEQFEQTLCELRSLLTRPTVDALCSIAFLRSSAGGLVAPEGAYIRSARLVQAMGEDGPYVQGNRESLYVRLRCRTRPSSDDVIKHLEKLRAAGKAPPHALYPLLVEALKVEDDDPAKLADVPILHDGARWVMPSEAVVGKHLRDLFLDSVPTLDAAALGRVYVELGVAVEPQDRHWAAFFSWIDARSRSGTGRLAGRERRALRMAFVRLPELPSGISSETRALLADDGRVYTSEDARSGKYLIDDDPRMAIAVRKAGLAIAFADLEDDRCRRFYLASGVRLLTDARRATGVKVGNERKPPPWFQESRQLDRLHRGVFGSAVSKIASVMDSSGRATTNQLVRRLRKIRRVHFVSSIEMTYRLGDSEVSVPADLIVDGDAIVLAPVRSRSELDGRIARGVAGLLGAAASQQHSLSDAIYRLLTCETTDEIGRYMEQRGVRWKADEDDEEASEQDLADEAADVGDSLKEELLRAMLTQPAAEPPAPAKSRTPVGAEAVQDPDQPSLPPLEEVNLQEINAPELPQRKNARERRGRGGGGEGWSPRTWAEQQQDQEIGARAEELVYISEVERVTALGHAATRVVWTSRNNPAADHDILSVADDGGDLWLEVKGTRGRHGRFSWPRAEFDRAVQARDRYVLCRVYEADTAAPTLTRIADPVGKLLAGEIRLDVETLAAEVAPLGRQKHKGGDGQD